LFEVRPDRAFAQNRTLYFTTPCFPMASIRRRSAERANSSWRRRCRRSETHHDVRVLLNAEGTNTG
jgi:hypothetical protein